MKLKPRTEQQIKRAIMDYLKAQGHFPIPYRNVGIRKQGGSWIPVSILGVSDIIGIEKGTGKAFFIEVKRKGNRPSRFQNQFLYIVRSYGCIGIVAYSVDDCIDAGL